MPQSLATSEQLKSLATEIDQQPISEVKNEGSLSQLQPCADCGKDHLRKRIVCCVDGTWMGPDGAAGSENGNASNIFRIWASIKTGIVEDENGKWQQIRRYFKGLGTDVGIFQKLYSGVTGSGLDDLIFRVYKASLQNFVK
ncbi:hypothetical protein TWF730_006292 [Orbilia blumenaviensis]|uniref:T6SS Phospholipase effector Tle1-like catalytic domain-containing protein n=1 Tax=Orbilia blumenaviensis TaxID=1796055 RepID=A0AAV9VG60_9PEZI